MQDDNRNNVKFSITFEVRHLENTKVYFIKPDNIFRKEATIRLLIRTIPFS